MRMRTAACVLAGLALLLGTGLARNASATEPPDLFQREPDLICLARIENLDAADAWITRWLREVQPRTDLAGVLRRHVGLVLRNPDLRHVPEGAALEVCVFDTPAGPPEAVWIHPVADPEEYRRILGDRPELFEEAASGEIAVFREGLDETGPRWYLAFTREGNALFGSSRETVAVIRRLYAENGEEGLLPAGNGSLRARVALTRLLHAERAWLERVLTRLVTDTADAMAPRAAETPETALALRAAAETAEDLLRQCGRTELMLDLAPDGLRLRARVRTEQGQLLQYILSEVPRPGLAASPGGGIPRDAVSWRRVLLWAPLWRQALEMMGAVVVERMGEGLDEPVRASFRGLLGGLEAVEPTRYAGGVILRRDGRVFLVRQLRVRNAPALQALLADALAVLKGEGVAKALDRIGWRFDIDLEPGAEEGGVYHLIWSLRPASEEEDDPEAALVGPPRTAYLGRSGATFAAVIPLGTETDTEAAAGATGLLADVLRPDLRSAESAEADGPPLVFRGVLHPWGYALAALMAVPDPAPAPAGEEDPWRGGLPVVYSLRADGGVLILDLDVPWKTAVLFGRNLLGTGTSERITRR